MTPDTQSKHGGYDWPLMAGNVSRRDLDVVIAYLQQDDPKLTAGPNVRAFEQEWSAWLGVRHSVLVNSGASANLLTIKALCLRDGPGEVIVPPLTWSSDIASLLHCGCVPVFADIDPQTLALDPERVAKRITADTRAVFLTHILGYNGLSSRLLDVCSQAGVPLIEDACESHGATFNGRKVGTFGLMSNFSFYYAHHLTTVEGGMICTNDPELYEKLRMLRAHGLVREAASPAVAETYSHDFPDLSPDFIFACPGFNVRSSEISALIGRSQLTRLDHTIQARQRNLRLFLGGLDPSLYVTDFQTEGSSNYAFTLVLRQADPALRDRVEALMQELGVEFRRGLSGGGNQLRQPYLRELEGTDQPENYPVTEHVHFFGYYIGNYPDLPAERIRRLCERLNGLAQ